MAYIIEHKILLVPAGASIMQEITDTSVALNQAGKEGWEMIDFDRDANGLRIFMKRPQKPWWNIFAK